MMTPRRRLSRVVCWTLLLTVSLSALPDASGGTGEEVAVTMTSGSALKLYAHGIHGGPQSVALRSAMDGNASPLLLLAGVEPANSLEYHAEVRKVCAEVTCGDGALASGDDAVFSALVETSPMLYELLVRSGVFNITLSLNGMNPSTASPVTVELAAGEGPVSSGMPIPSDLIVNLEYPEAVTGSATVSIGFAGDPGDRSVRLTFVTRYGWVIASTSGIDSETVRNDWPSSGYATVEGVMSSGEGATIETRPSSGDLMCWTIVGVVLAVSGAGMLFAWRRMRGGGRSPGAHNTRESHDMREKGGPDPNGRGRMRKRLEEMRRSGLITEEEFREKLADMPGERLINGGHIDGLGGTHGNRDCDR